MVQIAPPAPTSTSLTIPQPEDPPEPLVVSEDQFEPPRVDLAMPTLPDV